MATLSATGLEIDTLEETLESMKSDVRSAISPNLNLSESSLLGQYLGVTASQLRQLEEALQVIYASRDPYQAYGDSLAALTRLQGTERLGATYSTAVLTVNLDAGLYLAGTLVVNKVGDPTVRFENVDDVNVAVTGNVAGVEFVSQTSGPVQANSGTLLQIANPIVGFNSVVSQPLDAIMGEDQESDSSLRARWQASLSATGRHTVDAIRAKILQVSGVTFARVYENDTRNTTVDGLPGNSFESLVVGGDDQDIADTIFLAKPAGIRAYGTTLETVSDSQGNGHTVGFSRPTTLNVYVTVNVTYQAGQFPGVTALKQTIVDWGDATLGPGNDVLASKLVTLIGSQPGVVDVTVKIGTAPSPVSSANLVVGARQVADLDTSRTIVNATAVNGVP